MFTRDTDVAPQQEYYADSLLTKPTVAHSVFTNLSMGFATPIVALNMLDHTYAQKPEGQAMISALESMQLENETPGVGWGQLAANQAANMVGFGLNPVTWAFAGAGNLAAKGATSVATRLAPSAASIFMRTPLTELLGQPIGKYVPGLYGKEKLPLSLGLIGEKALDTFTSFAGAGIPQGIVDNFNQDSDHINWGGVARESGEMGGFGLAIGSIPFAFGLLRGKINRAIGDVVNEPITTEKLNQALEAGDITADEHKWYSDYLSHSSNPKENPNALNDLQTKATEIINKNGSDANTVTHEAPFDILKPSDIENLKGAASDQLVADVPKEFKTSLSDFMVNNRLDEIREDSTKLDGVRGYVDFVKEKLKTKSEKLAEADKILDKHLFKSVKENMPLSQKSLLKMMKKTRFESSHIKHLPLNIPENIKSIFKRDDKISLLQKKLKVYEKEVKAGKKGFYEKVLSVKSQIEKIQTNVPKILTPKEELTDIRNKLLTDKGLPNNWERSPTYHRLLDLAHVWKNAKSLVDRVHLERDFEKQEAFMNLADHVLKVSDSNITRMTKPSDVLNYLKARLERKILHEEPIKDINQKVKEQNQVPPDADSILQEQELKVRESKSEELSKEFDKSSEKFKEFKSSENIFKNLISCVLGARNV